MCLHAFDVICMTNAVHMFFLLNNNNISNKFRFNNNYDNEKKKANYISLFMRGLLDKLMSTEKLVWFDDRTINKY